jgi:hypothetical protein
MYRGHCRTCPDCGTLNHAPIAAELKAHSIGPRFAATLSYLSGRCWTTWLRQLSLIARVSPHPNESKPAGRLPPWYNGARKAPGPSVVILLLVLPPDTAGLVLPPALRAVRGYRLSPP